MNDALAYQTRFCTHCATPLALITQAEDSGDVERLRCPACGWTHWNNPTPVLAAVVELDGRILLARNAAWKMPAFGLITGFMEAGETPQEGIAREIKEETSLDVDISALQLIGVYDFQRMNQVIIAFHTLARGTVQLSPELVDYRLVRPERLQCWPAGTGYALADWLRGRGIEPEFVDFFRTENADLKD
ncbi:NUDIX hydrolase [Simplicispira psychrophila]|uniref:NUDIX hydrolase n=1 Tax=Simplicispira psychrophila TaxID=80882 RepID=UPI000486FF79|nr:NUDIX hydrolase [Simplicispira psychrophila]